MSQIEPREYFTIVRQIDDPADAETYYIRAVIRNARTDTILDTVDLTDQGNQRFSKPWQTPADTSGMGFWISIETTVYTDSGYTTKSDSYGIQAREHLIQQRVNANNLGGSGGADVDYKKIRKILVEVFADNKIEIPPATEIAPILEALVVSTKDIKESMPANPDDTKVLKGILALAELVEANKPTPPTEPEPIDFKPVLDEIAKVNPSTQNQADSLREVLKLFLNDKFKEIVKSIEGGNTSLKDVKDRFDKMPFITLSPDSAKTKEPKHKRKFL